MLMSAGAFSVVWICAVNVRWMARGFGRWRWWWCYCSYELGGCCLWLEFMRTRLLLGEQFFLG